MICGFDSAFKTTSDVNTILGFNSRLIVPAVGGAPAGPATTAVFNGTNAYASFDALAPASYTQTSDIWWVFVHKGTAASTRFMSVGPTSPITNSWLLRTSGGNIAMNSNPPKSLSTSLNAADDNWNVVQGLDIYDDAGNGQLQAKLNATARVVSTAYVRYAQSAAFPKWITVAALRQNIGPTISLFSAGRTAYLALVTGCRPSDAQLTSVHTAFAGASGAAALQAISDQLQSLATTLGGTVEWAGPLDNAGSPHIDTGGYGDPTFVNATFEQASF